MLIIGERINTSRKEVSPAVAARESSFVRTLARNQMEAGAAYIDLNCGTLGEQEPEGLEWLVTTVQAEVDAPLALDSPNPDAIRRAMRVYDAKSGRPMINSITAERDRYERILPLVLEYRAKVIALSMDDSGIRADSSERFNVAKELAARLLDAGVPADDIYLDPLTFPIGTGSETGLAMLGVIERLSQDLPGIHIIAGISNVSHGLPSRKLLNQAMTMLAMGRGLDAAIIDPLDRGLMALIAAAEALLGRDQYCRNYISLARQGRFKDL
jgi:5-methyltetrahydrofolate--homocysteine methyltransferase